MRAGGMVGGRHGGAERAAWRRTLAEDVHAQDSLRDALVLHLRGVLEAAVDDSAEELGLEEEVAEAGGVDAGVGAAPGRWREEQQEGEREGEGVVEEEGAKTGTGTGRRDEEREEQRADESGDARAEDSEWTAGGRQREGGGDDAVGSSDCERKRERRQRSARARDGEIKWQPPRDWRYPQCS